MDIVSNLKTGDIILFHTEFNILKPSTWVGAIIRLFIHSHYNHVGIVISNWNVNFINEATGKGITAHLASHKLQDKKYKVLRPNVEINERYLATLANNMLGVAKYNYFVLCIIMFWYKLTGNWALSNRESIDTNRFVCSTYVAYCYNFLNWSRYDPSTFEKNNDLTLIYSN